MDDSVCVCTWDQTSKSELSVNFRGFHQRRLGTILFALFSANTIYYRKRTISGITWQFGGSARTYWVIWG